MMDLKKFVLVLALTAPTTLLCQPPISISGVDEPPELLGPPKKFTPPSPAMIEFGKIMENWKESDSESIKKSRAAFTQFLENHPEFAPAYAMRAMSDFCFLNSKEYDSITNDVENVAKTGRTDTNVFGPSDLTGSPGQSEIRRGKPQGSTR